MKEQNKSRLRQQKTRRIAFGVARNALIAPAGQIRLGQVTYDSLIWLLEFSKPAWRKPNVSDNVAKFLKDIVTPPGFEEWFPLDEALESSPRSPVAPISGHSRLHIARAGPSSRNRGRYPRHRRGR